MTGIDPRGTREQLIRDQQEKAVDEIRKIIKEMDDDLIRELENVLIQEGVRRAVIASQSMKNIPF